MKLFTKTYQIYVYDRQLIRYSNQKNEIDGYYYDRDFALRNIIRSSSLEPHQFVLCELTNSTCEIIAMAKSGKFQYVL